MNGIPKDIKLIIINYGFLNFNNEIKIFLLENEVVPKKYASFISNDNWKKISRYQKLSENFIREFQNYVNWWWISGCQKLSEGFILEFQNKVD